jgi:hypothetical protein
VRGAAGVVAVILGGVTVGIALNGGADEFALHDQVAVGEMQNLGEVGGDGNFVGGVCGALAEGRRCGRISLFREQISSLLLSVRVGGRRRPNQSIHACFLGKGRYRRGSSPK